MVRMIAGKLITESTEEEPGTIVVNPTVTWNPSASPIQITLREWNRDFAEGTLEAWTYVDAEISTEDPYEGDFCVELTETGAYIFQTLDEPVPVYAVYEFSVWLKRKVSGDSYTLRMHHTDGTTNDVSGVLTSDDWQRIYFERSMMDTSKILSAVSVRSYEGHFFADKIFLGIATEVIAGSVESLQTIPRSLQAEVIARPKGYEMTGFPKTGSVATSATEWRTVTGAQYTPEDKYKFMLTKILVSCPSDVLYRLCWGEPPFSDDDVFSAAQVFVTGGIPFTDWFPWGYHRFWGDGERTFEIQVRAPTADDEDTCYAEIVGEHVETIFNL